MNEYEAVAESVRLMAQDEDRIQHVLNIDIPAWQSGRGDWFTVMLLALIAKADPQNQARLGDGFPLEVEAYERWMKQ